MSGRTEAALELPAFLAAAARTPFAWGRHDCCLFLADWVLLRTGFDPARTLRGRYHDAETCDELVSAAGGVAALVGRCARRARLAERLDPAAGDVGLIEALTSVGTIAAAGAIFGGRRWVALTQQGVIGLRMAAPPLACWEVPCRR